MRGLDEIEKRDRTPEIIRMRLTKNGCEIRELDVDEITEELAIVAVESNGFAYRHLPEQYKTKDMLRRAIVHTDGMFISEYMTDQPLDPDLQLVLVQYGCGYLFRVANPTQEAFDKAFELEPVYMIMQFQAGRTGNPAMGKLLQHRHLISYFERYTMHGIGNSYAGCLSRFTDDVSDELLIGIYRVAPSCADSLENYPNWHRALRNEKIRSLL